MLAEKLLRPTEPPARGRDASDSDCMSVVTLKSRRKVKLITQIASAENNLVFWIRMIVLAVLVISTVSVALVVYFYTSNTEEEASRNSS
jgi:hypothetical protein